VRGVARRPQHFCTRSRDAADRCGPSLVEELHRRVRCDEGQLNPLFETRAGGDVTINGLVRVLDRIGQFARSAPELRLYSDRTRSSAGVCLPGSGQIPGAGRCASAPDTHLQLQALEAVLLPPVSDSPASAPAVIRRVDR